MPGPFEALRFLLESIPPGSEKFWYDLCPGKDRVLRELSSEEIQKHEELCSLESELKASLRKSLRYVRLFESKRFLMADGLRMSLEQAETAESRKCILGLRKTAQGRHVLVETSMEDME